MTEDFKKEGRIIVDGVNVISCKYFLFRDDPSANERTCGIGLTSCKGKNCDFKEIANLKRENKEKIDIIEQMIKILYPNASDDELYDVTFNGEYIDKLKELKDTADTMLMANDIKKQDIDSLREANDRLEQENKELKEKIIELSEEKGHLIVENNTLKESNQSLSMLGTDLASANETVRKEFFRADKNKDMWREKAEEYHSALEEIRVIAENLSPCKLDYSDVYCHQTDCTDCIQRIILKKINEVLNENKSSK